MVSSALRYKDDWKETPRTSTKGDEWHVPREYYKLARALEVPNLPAPPVRLTEIEQAIDASRELLNLPTDWDEAGAKPIEQSTWQRATNTLLSAARTAHNRLGFVLPPPTVGPCPDGSLDLYWKTESFTLLINVQPGDAESDFFGERVDKPGFRVQGPFSSAQPDFQFLSLLVER